MKRYIKFVAVFFYLCPVCSIAQTVDFSGKDSISVWDKVYIQADTARVDSQINENSIAEPEKFKPNPKKALFLALVPGGGHIYNRKYWKLPLVYGSFIGCFYAINWNGNQHSGYRNAYLDFIDDDPATNSWDDYRYGSYRRVNPEDWTNEMKNSFATSLKNARDFHRRNRDLSYIVTVGFYAIWIIDAYVDAQLFDFDISPDLSMRLEPVFFDRTPNHSRTLGLQFCFTF